MVSSAPNAKPIDPPAPSPSSAEITAARSSTPTAWEQHVISRSSLPFAVWCWCRQAVGAGNTWAAGGGQGRDAGGCNAEGCHVEIEGMAGNADDREALERIAVVGGRFEWEMS